MRKAFLMTTLLLLLISLIYPGSQSGQAGRPVYFLTPVESIMESNYRLLHDSSVNIQAFHLAMLGYQSLTAKGLVSKDSLLTIIDYSKPSSEKRFFVIDLSANRILFKSLVAHGRNSGELYASQFSNRSQSHQSALGFYITGSPYIGSQGYSLLMTGVDTGFNDNARIRSIVMHAASYVSQKYISLYGRLGRSLGCPALPAELNASIIDLIRDGSVVFSYYPDPAYITSSRILCYRPVEKQSLPEF